MVLVFWAVTPLQSAQLGTGAVNLDESRHIVNRSRLAPLENQESLLGPEILNTGYAVGWLEQSFPPFMTAERAFLPFYVDDTDVPAKSGANWTASTTELSTELDCWPAEYSRNGFNESLTFGFQNGQGCNASLNMPASSADGTVPHAMFYIGYYNSPYGTFWLDSPTCPPTEKSTHQFLAVWTNPVESSKEAGPAGDTFFDFEFNAQYCQTSYYKQEVLITVNADSLEPYPDTAEAISNRELLSESEFNTTAFEFLLSNGMPQEIKNRDHPYTFQVEQHPRIKDFNLTMPVSNMVGFALAGEDSSTADFPDPEYIHDIFIRAHRYLFSLAVNQVLVNETTSANQTATATFPMHGIIVSRAISAALEALLLLVAVFTAVIIWLCHKSPLNLRVNPSSISRVIEIFRDSPQLLDSFCTVDNADEKSLWKSASNEKFRLIWNENQQCHEIVLRKGPIIDEKRKAELQKGYYEPIRPLALRLGSGIAFVVAIIGVMAGLSYLKWAEVEFTGKKGHSPIVINK